MTARSVTWGVALAVALAGRAALADVSGPARVIDGDTIEVAGERVRLYGIDAPETRQACGDAGARWGCGVSATKALKRRIAGRAVACSAKGRDRYGRLVAVCRSGGDLNGWMVAQGWALAYRRYSLTYAPAEDAARAAGRGVWRGAFEAPWDWRRRQRESSRACEGWRTVAFFARVAAAEVRRCLVRGADPEWADESGWTRLHVAAAYARPEVVRELLAAQADRLARGASGMTPGHAAASNSRWPGVIALLLGDGSGENNAQWTRYLEARDEHGATPLITASEWGEVPEIVVALVRAGADVTARDADGWTAARHVAANEQLAGTVAEWAVAPDRGGRDPG